MKECAALDRDLLLSPQMRGREMIPRHSHLAPRFRLAAHGPEAVASDKQNWLPPFPHLTPVGLIMTLEQSLQQVCDHDSGPKKPCSRARAGMSASPAYPSTRGPSMNMA